jgi:hypothetical protein
MHGGNATMACSGRKGKRGGKKRRGILEVIGDYFTGPLKELFLVFFEG